MCNPNSKLQEANELDPVCSKVDLASNDPWEHRSKRMKCRTCIWFVKKTSNVIQRKDETIGRCRYHAPTMNGYPVVFEGDWCGDHKLDENKI